MEEKIRVSENISGWSKEAQMITENALDNPPAITDRNYILKNCRIGKEDYQYGFLKIEDLLSYNLMITTEDGLDLHYNSKIDLINDGWIFD